MKRIAFRMKLHDGQQEEYKKRHDEIWPELAELLKSNGISDYSIFLDENSNDLFAVLKVENESVLENLPSRPVMKKWWAYMKDVMDTNVDYSPTSVPLKEVFHLR